MSDDSVKKILVQPYPIRAQFSGSIDGEGEIVFLVPMGFQLETKKPLKVHDRIKIKFEIPVTYRPVEAECIIVKTYDDRGTTIEGEKVRLAEGHFRNLDYQSKSVIKEFCRKIGQKIR